MQCQCKCPHIFESDSVTEIYTLRTQCSKLVNYGAKLLKVAGPLLWNSLPLYVRNVQSVFSLKFNLKKFLIGQYDTEPEVLSNHYYISNISFHLLKLVFSKMHTFFVPPYLPDCILQVRKISNDGLKIKIVRKSNFCAGGVSYCVDSLSCTCTAIIGSSSDSSIGYTGSSSISSDSSSGGGNGSGGGGGSDSTSGGDSDSDSDSIDRSISNISSIVNSCLVLLRQLQK